MTLAERKRQFEIVLEEVGDRCRTIMSCSDENLDVVLELGRHAENIGGLAAVRAVVPATKCSIKWSCLNLLRRLLRMAPMITLIFGYLGQPYFYMF